MSAYIVSKAHIDALITAAGSVNYAEHDSGLSWYVRNAAKPGGYDHHELSYSDRERASEVGAMLWAENLTSINYRYPDTIEDMSNCPGPVGFGLETVDEYTFRPTARLSVVTVLKAIACYEYQTCEHPTWKDSEAYAFCQELKEKMIRQLPGYDDAPWGLRDEHVKAFAGI